MQKSESIGKLAAALVAAQAEFPPITLDDEVKVRTKMGGEYKFKYATLGNIMRSVRPVLNKHGLAVVQAIQGKALVTQLIHASGEMLSSECDLPYVEDRIENGKIIEGMNNQERGSVVTYFRRYSLTCLLGLVADEDEDGNLGAGNTATREQAAPKKEVTPKKEEHHEESQEDDFLTIEGTLKDVEKKDGVGKNGKPYTRYGLKMDNGKIYGTFDSKLGDAAETLKGENVSLRYKQEGKFLTALGISPLDGEPATEDAPF